MILSIQSWPRKHFVELDSVCICKVAPNWNCNYYCLVDYYVRYVIILILERAFRLNTRSNVSSLWWITACIIYRFAMIVTTEPSVLFDSQWNLNRENATNYCAYQIWWKYSRSRHATDFSPHICWSCRTKKKIIEQCNKWLILYEKKQQKNLITELRKFNLNSIEKFNFNSDPFDYLESVKLLRIKETREKERKKNYFVINNGITKNTLNRTETVIEKRIQVKAL